MLKLRKTAIFIACLLAFARVGVLALAEEAATDAQAVQGESESQNDLEVQIQSEVESQNEPEIQSVPDLQNEPGVQNEPDLDQKLGGDVLSVLLPCEIPFNIVIVQSSFQGFVTSKDFTIANNGDSDIIVEIQSVQLEIENEEFFSISEEAQLPETGNNIFVELTCRDNNSSGTSVLTSSPSNIGYRYYLAAGESGSFDLSGVANEFGDIPWSDTTVRVHVSYSIISANAAFDVEETSDMELVDEELSNEEFLDKELLDNEQGTITESAAGADVDETEEPQEIEEPQAVEEINDNERPEEPQAEKEEPEEADDTEVAGRADISADETDESITALDEAQHDTEDFSSAAKTESPAVENTSE